jgi:DNA polymerase-3 subunit beta
MESGTTIVPFAYLIDHVGRAADPMIQMSSDRSLDCQFRSGRSGAKIPCQSIDNFKEDPFPKIDQMILVPPDLLRSILDTTMHAIYTDAGRANLEGVFLRLRAVDPGPRLQVEGVATDGHRLSRLIDRIELPQTLKLPDPVIVRRDGIKALAEFLDDSYLETEICFCDKSSVSALDPKPIVFQQGPDVLVVQTIDAAFPEYERVIPTESKTRIVVDRNGLISEVDRAAVVVPSDRTPAVKFNLQESVLQLSCMDPDRGDSCTSIDVAVTGEPRVEFHLNAKFLRQALSATPEGEVQIAFTTPNNAIVLTSLKDDRILHLLMPIRV